MPFTLTFKKIKGAADKEGDFNGSCEQTLTTENVTKIY